MVSGLGDAAIGAVGAANRFLSIPKIGFIGIAVANGVLSSQYFAKGNKKGVVRAFGSSLIMGLIFSSIIGLLYLMNSDTVVSKFSSDLAIQGLIKDYLSFGILESVVVTVVATLSIMMSSTGYAKFPFYGSLISLFINAFLNYGLIFGNLGFPALGVKGAAIATLISETISVTILLAGAIILKQPIISSFRDTFIIPKSYWKKILKLASPMMVSNFLWSWSRAYIHTIIGSMGIYALSSYGALVALQDLFLHLFIGLAQAAVVIVGGELGKKNLREAYQRAKEILIFSVGIGIVLGGLIFLFSPILSSLYYKLDLKSIDKIDIMLKIFGVFLGIRAFNLVSWDGIFSSGGDTKFMLILGPVDGWLISAPIAYISFHYFKLNIEGLYWWLSWGEIISLVIFIWRFRSKKWLRNLTEEDEYEKR